MNWSNARKVREESGSNKFIKLKDGDSIEGVFRGDPYTFYQKFKDPNEYLQYAEGRSFKFKVNFIVKENDTLVSKILQQGATVFDLIVDAIDEYGADCVFKIKRVGSGKEDTRYSVLFKGNLTSEQISQYNAVKLNSLKRALSEEDERNPPLSDEDDISFP